MMFVMRTALLIALSFFTSDASAPPTAIYRHGWGTVADVMSMHGKYTSPDALPDDASVAFVAAHYGMVTTGSGCPKRTNKTLEDAARSVATRIKNANPDALVGMYMRTDMQLEVATAGCTSISAQLLSHGTEYSLRDDNGTLIKKGSSYLWDYTNPKATELFATYLLDAVKDTLPSGKPVLDYIYLDGPSWDGEEGINAARSAKIGAAKVAFFADLQARFNALPYQRNVILNGVDTLDTAQLFNPTGAAGVMFDHWSILQYLYRGHAAGCDDADNKTATCGDFNATAMDSAFALARSSVLANMTLQIKGWVGPVIKQQGQYPPSIPTPSTPAEQAAVAAERFNSELALFLLVAEDHMFWLYSWFWGFDSWIPDHADSQTPHGFYPQAKCALGAPTGPPQRTGGTWTYHRDFEHASVFVDLNNRTACRVDFKEGSC